MDKNNTIVIRRGIDRDAENLFRIHVDAVESQCKNFYTQKQIKGWFEDRTAAEYVEHINRGKIWVAMEAEQIIGFTECWPGHIDRMFVPQWAAGKGVGSSLLKFAISHAFSDGCAVVRLEATLNAQRFYEKHGFEKKSDSSFVQPSGTKIETVLMEIRRPSD